MIYQDLEKMLQSLADKGELWEKLNEAVLDLADKNFDYLTISLGILFAIIGIPTLLANFQIRKERKELGNLKKDLDSHEDRIEKQEGGIDEIKNSLLFQNKKTEEQTVEIEGLRKDAESFLQSGREQAAGFKKEFDKQAVMIKYESYLSSILIDNLLLKFFAWRHYALAEYNFWEKYSNFAATINFKEFIEDVEESISSAAEDDRYIARYHKFLIEGLAEFCKIPKFKKMTSQLIEKSKNSIQNSSSKPKP